MIVIIVIDYVHHEYYWLLLPCVNSELCIINIVGMIITILTMIIPIHMYYHCLIMFSFYSFLYPNI